jgi:hypothetical protein
MIALWAALIPVIAEVVIKYGPTVLAAIETFVKSIQSHPDHSKMTPGEFRQVLEATAAEFRAKQPS